MATGILEARNLLGKVSSLPFQPSGWELTSYPADAGITPSWCWSCQFGTGRHIYFEHTRRYVREECLEIQIINCLGVPSLTSEGIQSPKTSASLTVTAYVKLAEVRQRIPFFGGILSGIFASGFDVTDEKRDIVAGFWPDDPSTTFDDTGRLAVLCVLCAVAEAQPYDHVSERDTMLSGIAVLPYTGDTFKYRRIGLLKFRYEHNASKSPHRTSSPAAGVSRATFDLV
jgi:hypothetical protein